MKRLALSIILVISLAIGLWQLSKSRTWQLAGTLVPRVETTDSLVALTFDDGPMPGYTDSVLAILRRNEVAATFFVTGRETELNLVEARKLVEAGHQLGNHSYSHKQMVMKGPYEIYEEIVRTDSAIRKAGYIGPIYFRPPFGKKLFMLPWFLSRENRVSVTWDIEPESYPEVRNSARSIAAHIGQKVRPGSIILLHAMYPSGSESRKSLPLFIDDLKRRGYRFVTVSELIAKGVEPLGRR